MPTKKSRVSKPKRIGTMPVTVKQDLVSRYPKSQALHNKFGGIQSETLEKLGIDAFGRDGEALRLPPEIRDPRFQQDNYFIPQTDVISGEPNTILNYWFDYYYRFHPLVGNLIDLHSTLPLSRFGLTGISDAAILREYEEMCDDMQLFERMVDTLKLYFLRGEAMPFLWWNDEINRFNDITMLDTNYIFTIGHYLFYSPQGDITRRYELRPDEYIRGLVNSDNDIDRQLVSEFLDEKIISAISSNMNLELDPFATEMLIKAANPWHIRGSSICEGIVKDLLYEDKLRKAQEAIATGHITPIKLWKIGEAGAVALPEDLAAFRDTLFETNNDPQVNLVTHHAVNLTVEGSSGRILPLAPEFQHVEGRILTRLFSNKSMTDGSGPTYANASVSLRILMARYIPIRTMLENFFYRKAFLPVSIANGYLKITTAELSHGIRRAEKDREPLTPMFDWRHKQSLIDDSNIKGMLLQLQSKTMLSMKTICETLNIDYETERQRLKDEQGGIFDGSMVKAREAEVMNIAKAGGKARFKMFFKSIFDWTRLLAGTAKEKEELFNEDQPDDPNEVKKSPEGDMTDGGEGGDFGGAMDSGDIEEGAPEEVSDESPEGQASQKKKTKIPKTFTASQYEEGVKQIDKIFRKSGDKIIDFFKKREKAEHGDKKKHYDVRGQLFKAATVRSTDPWYKELGSNQLLDLNSKKAIMNIDSNIKTLLIREGRLFVSRIAELYKEENDFKISLSSLDSEFKLRVNNVKRDISNDTTEPLRTSINNIISNNYDKASPILSILNTNEKLQLKVEAGKISTNARKIVDSLITEADSSSMSEYREIIGGLEAKDDIVTSLLFDENDEISKDALYTKSQDLWKKYQQSFLTSIRKTSVELLQKADLEFNKVIKAANKNSNISKKEKNEHTSKKNS